MSRRIHNILFLVALTIVPFQTHAQSKNETAGDTSFPSKFNAFTNPNDT